MVRMGQALERRGLIAGNAGNLSARLGADHILTTPTGALKGMMAPEDLVVVDLEGCPIPGQSQTPSSELKVHLAIYAKHSRVQAIVHAHPITATAIALQPTLPNYCITAEGAASLGTIIRVPYLPPGDWPLARACARAAEFGDIVILRHHGAVTMGQTLQEAFARMDALEHVSKIYRDSMMLGHVPTLELEEVHRLRQHTGAAQWVAIEDLTGE